MVSWVSVAMRINGWVSLFKLLPSSVNISFKWMSMLMYQTFSSRMGLAGWLVRMRLLVSYAQPYHNLVFPHPLDRAYDGPHLVPAQAPAHHPSNHLNAFHHRSIILSTIQAELTMTISRSPTSPALFNLLPVLHILQARDGREIRFTISLTPTETQRVRLKMRIREDIRG